MIYDSTANIYIFDLEFIWCICNLNISATFGIARVVWLELTSDWTRTPKIQWRGYAGHASSEQALALSLQYRTGSPLFKLSDCDPTKRDRDMPRGNHKCNVLDIPPHPCIHTMATSKARYEAFLINNVSTISTLESSLRSITWFLPGRFKDAELASEARPYTSFHP